MPADDPVQMTIIHAFVSREEFMHGEWDVALVHSCAQLRIAAIELFFELLEADGADEGPSILRIQDIWLTAQEIDRVAKPFQEAVDKIQILSVVFGDTPFFTSIEEIFQSEYGQNAMERYYDGDESDLRVVLERQVDEQLDIATGAKTVDLETRANLYVNPLYTYALASVAEDSESDPSHHQRKRNGLPLDQLSQRRPIAEAVAKVTLDIPNPIAPLGPDATHDDLRVTDIDVDPLSLDALIAETEPGGRYYVTEAEYEEYLLSHRPKVRDDDLRAELGSTVDEYAPNWLDAVFVSTLKALEDLQTADELPTDPLRLRRKLSKAVHGVDVEDPETSTMVDNPTHLLSIPAEASDEIEDTDYISQDGEPLPKIILEAFEQHGSFGAVVFRPSEGDNQRQMNFHAVATEDVQSHPDVPDGIETYEELWNRYFVGKEFLNTLWRQYHAYGDYLRDALESAYKDGTVTDRELRAFKTGSVPSDSHDNTEPSDIQRAVEIADEVLTQEPIGQRLESWTPAELWAAATTLDIECSSPAQYDSLPTFTCPLCELVEPQCGGSECLIETLAERFRTKAPHLLTSLYKSRAPSIGEE
ncbi:hypothetical protein [Halobaculum sp. EA56]|uniref:hypothetical protein n=1 Tax=Halobaculum sp. EA56 TaxID=3421648 RepID=UPI003EBA0592